jgi:hypothetical protein
MDIGSIFLILTLVILVALFVGRPFFKTGGTSGGAFGSVHTPSAAFTQEEHTLSTLLAEKDRVINSLQELDFDNTLGKIPAEDYPRQREFLLQHGVELLREIDATSIQQQAAHSKLPDTGSLMQDHLEAAITARRMTTPVSPAVVNEIKSSDDPYQEDAMETLIAARKRERRSEPGHQTKTGGFCPKCGRPVQKSDSFCPKCGAKLA